MARCTLVKKCPSGLHLIHLLVYSKRKTAWKKKQCLMESPASRFLWRLCQNQITKLFSVLSPSFRAEFSSTLSPFLDHLGKKFPEQAPQDSPRLPKRVTGLPKRESQAPPRESQAPQERSHRTPQESSRLLQESHRAL